MIVGAPKEIKARESRVALTPDGARALTSAGCEVRVERGAGEGSGFSDADYEAAGARLTDAAGAWAAGLVVKVKEPLPPEYPHLRDDLILFTFLHLAAAEELTRELLARGTAAVAYETVKDASGGLPLLAPMSEVAGRMSAHVGAYLLQKPEGGRGVLLGGVPGVEPGHAVVLGAGVVAANACRMLVGLGARVTALSVRHESRRRLDDLFPGRVATLPSTPENIRRLLPTADLVIGAALVPGGRAPTLVTRDMLSLLPEGAVIVDVAVDQGGCVETIRPTTHDDPTYVVDGVLHYGVANMPGAAPRTSTLALTGATLPYVLRLAGEGLTALAADPLFAAGLNTKDGRLACAGVGRAFGLPWSEPLELLRPD